MIKKYALLLFPWFLFFAVPLHGQALDSLTYILKDPINAVPPPIFEDFGDAPNTYVTEKESGGPVHTRLYGMPLVKIGKIVDYEYFAFSSSEADGDDLDQEYDEDAITEDDFMSLNKDSDDFSLELNYYNGAEHDVNLYAWIDFDRSGQFDADEFTSFLGLKPGDGKSTLTWSDLKSNGVDINEGASFARFRITFAELTNSDVGGNVLLGEVEDHAIFIGQSVLSLEDELLQQGFKLLPNPVTSTLQIKSHNLIEKLEIYSIIGEKILEIHQGFERIDLTTVQPGIYFVCITSDKGTAVKKLIRR